MVQKKLLFDNDILRTNDKVLSSSQKQRKNENIKAAAFLPKSTFEFFVTDLF